MAERRCLLKSMALGGAMLSPLGQVIAATAKTETKQDAVVWLLQGDASASNSEQINLGTASVLRHSSERAYRVTNYQQLRDIKPGYYSLHAKVRSSGDQLSCFMFARIPGYSMARSSLLASTGFTDICVPGLVVSDGTLTFGLHTQAGAGSWAELDDIRLVREERYQPLLIGGDISTLSLMEKKGAHYRDRLGKEADALTILKNHGVGIARIRLYHNPGPGRGNEGFYWPADSMNLQDGLALAKRAKEQGMQIQLTLHYSDFWTNSQTQNIPAQWRDALAKIKSEEAKFDKLRQCVFDYTRTVMLAMKAQDTVPEFVSIGNEVEAGMLYPFGKAEAGNWHRLSALFDAGYRAVKEVAADSRVIIHLDDAGNIQKYQDYFQAVRKHGARWDVIGSSYYPFWSKKTIEQMVDFAEKTAAQFDSDIMLMETGFNWTPNLPDGYPGQLSDNGPYPAAMSSPQGQRDFMNTLFSQLKCRRQARVIGVLYWDPVFIDAEGIGWAYREADDQPGKNVVSNTTLFDFKGKALPVLDIWRDHAAALNLNHSHHQQKLQEKI